MNDTTVLTYEQIVTGHTKPEASREPSGQEIGAALYKTSLTAIEKGLAIYRTDASEHEPLMSKHVQNKKILACFVPRKGQLPPRETWMALVSEFSPPGRDKPFYVVDRLRILLPDFDNFGPRLDLAIAALQYISDEYKGKDILFPSISTEKTLSKSKALPDTVISKYAMRRCTRGTMTLRINNTLPTRSFSFHRL